MADFSGKIVDAQYANPDHSIVKVTYEQDGALYAYHLDADPSHPEWQEFEAEGWDHERLIESTANVKRAQAAAFNTEVNAAAQVLAREMLGMDVIQQEKERLLAEVENKEKQLLDLDKTAKVRTKSVDGELYDYLLNENNSKEELFKCKLWALELEVAKNSTKEVKSSIRKATRITEVLSIVDNIVK